MREVVSIIIPVYNVEKYLEKCINSVLEQTFKDIKIILVDDGSTDKSPDICDKYSKKDERVCVIHKKNQGVSEARNTGINNANGKYVIFIDSDDCIDKDLVDKYIQLMERKKADFLLNRYRVIDNQNVRDCIEFYKTGSITREQAFNFLFCQHGVFGSVWCKMFVLDVIKKNNLKFDASTRIAEDLLFNAQYMKFANSIVYINEPKYSYYLRKDSALGNFWLGYNEKWFEYLWVMKQFLYNDKYSYITCKDTIKASYCRTCINVYARLKVLNKREDVRKDIKKEAHKYMPYLIKGDTFSSKTKIITVLKYIFPSIVKVKS